MPTYIPPDNRPLPVAGAPIPMLADERHQMSFGERAAFEGLLAQLDVDVAIEIGTYDGGSLRPLAARSATVHTFDTEALVPDADQLTNVVFHVGDSKAILPGVLAELEAGGHRVQFALVDGDHSTAGVRADLRALLDSPVTDHTVIVAHDAVLPEVRQGILESGVEELDKVIYYDFDFVPGYTFRTGHFAGQTWGGLALIVTGHERSPGYEDSPRECRYEAPAIGRESPDALHEKHRLAAELAACRAARERQDRVMEAMKRSPSWRVTAPLRAAKHGVLRRLSVARANRDRTRR